MDFIFKQNFQKKFVFEAKIQNCDSIKNKFEIKSFKKDYYITDAI